MASAKEKRIKDLEKKRAARANKEVLPSFNYLITLMYDGSNYGGYAKQKHKNTIQDILNQVLRDYFKQEISTIESSRTDAKVHAIDQKVMFTTNTNLTINKTINELNDILPNDIIIKDITKVANNFHCRYDVKNKTYVYTISKSLDPRENNYAWYIKDKLDVKAMVKASKCLIGKHDFNTFKSSKAQSDSSIRTINSLDIKEDDKHITIEINGDGFLYNMVRLIVKALVDVGLHKQEVSYIQYLLDLKEKPSNLESAPAQGLCLSKINY